MRNEGYGTDFPHPAAECQTCRGTRRVWTAELDGSGEWDMACPDCDTPYPLPRMTPVRFRVRSGDMITIQWSGELRTVVMEVSGDELIIRNLTDAENQQLAEAAAAAEADKWQNYP